MFRHLIALLGRWRRIPPALPKAHAGASSSLPATPESHDLLTSRPVVPEAAAERDPPSRQRLSWPARDLSRSRRLARATPDDETVALHAPQHEGTEDEDDATIVLPRDPGRNGEAR